MKITKIFFIGMLLSAALQAQNCQLQKQRLQQVENTHTPKLQPAAGDSIHVMHYTITIDSIINNTVKAIYANTSLKIKARVNNVSVISLSLLKLNIDSIRSGNQLLTYTYNDTTISITAPVTLNTNDSIALTVYYHGFPQKDATGWGGFYFTSSHVFNLGVGFSADPHVYGRVWFPCIDEFTDKATYDFFIATSPTQKAFCNGILIDSALQPNTNNLIWHWKMNQPIPTYLACIAVANYFTLQQNINGITAQFATLAADTNKVKSTFVHLPDVMTTYINAYGPYPFDKIGYSMVPFGSGAMEHASQITVGAGFIDGTLNYETLWAHELSHMWWGDKVTCKTAGDMWLNEGWASFNEAYTREFMYGKQSYKDYVSANHKAVLQFAHVDDGGYLSMVNIPHAYTYGTTVYKKGADVAHTLRNFLGDSLFKVGMQYYMNNRAYGNADSYDFRDDITTATGVDATRFFDDWVFTEGFPHFSIDSVVYVPGGLDHYFVYTRQRSKGNNHLYSMPVDLTLSNGITDTTYTIVIDSATQVFHIATWGLFDWFTLDRGEKISDAITDDEIVVNTVGNVSIPETFTAINSTAVPVAGNIVRVEHNWVAPDGFKNSNPGIRLSNYRYWKVDGHFNTGYVAKATFTYDGRTLASLGHLDNTLGIVSEDSLVIVYRQGTWDEWKKVPQTTNFLGSHTDKVGTITVDTLMRGEYALGYYDYTVGMPAHQPKAPSYTLTVSPNPASKLCNIAFGLNNLKQATIVISDMRGNIVKTFTVFTHQEQVSWDTAEAASGTYNVCLFDNDKILNSTKLVLTK